MADVVLIEFQVDYSQLDKAIDTLEKTGAIDSKLAQDFKQTTAEINKQSQAIKQETAAANTAKKSLEDVNKATKGINQSMAQAFQEGVVEGFQDALQEAGVTMEEFQQRINEVANGEAVLEEKTVSLRTRMRLLQEQMVELKLRGEDNTDQFRTLAAEAGALQDAIDDANSEIKNVASDTRNLDDLLGSARAVTAGFALVQTSTALFGDESEELQKTLLKVSSAMIALQSVQEISLALEKEGALTRFANTAATKAQTAAQVVYNTVVGSSIGLMKALRIALAATGVGLLVFGLIELVKWLNESEDSLIDLDSELEKSRRLIESETEAIQTLSEVEIARAELAGKKEIEIARLKEQALRQERQLLFTERERLLNLRDNFKGTREEHEKLLEQIDQQDKKIKDINKALGLAEIEQQKIIRDQSLKAAEEAKKAAEDAARKRRELRERQLRDELAALERQLLAAEISSQKELDIKKKLVQAKANLDLNQENLTKNQVLLIREQSLSDQLKLTREFNEKLTAEAIAAQISRNNAELANIQANADDRLLLTISNIELQAEAETAAANGNAAKIKEINAKRDADIAAARKSFIEDSVNYEISLEQARQGAVNRGLQRIADDEKRSAELRIAAVQQIAEFEINQIDKRLEALEQERKQKLISEQEYNQQYAQLQNQRSIIYENTEGKITAINKSETEKRKQQERETIELVLNTTQQVIGILDQLNATRTQRDDERLNAERTRVDELLEAGAITEREAIARNKRIDQEEKKLKREQAQRDKNIAIFNSIINTARSVTAALTSTPPNIILAAIVGAIGAAQTAAIAARPIPKFKKGKKNRYEGLSEVGEAGTELVEHNGRMYIADKPQIVWLGKTDKVYTPAETKQMLPVVDKKLMSGPKEKDVSREMEKMTARMEKAISKMPGFGLTVDENGFKAFMQEGNSRKIYHDKYYSSK